MGEATDKGVEEAKNFFGKMFKKDDGDGGDGAKPDAATSGAAGAGNNKPAANMAFGFTDKQAKYRGVPWSNLPLSARKANKALGHDRDSWDAGKTVPADSRKWADLSPSDKTACTTLGWDEASWDAKYHGTAWKDLPGYVRRAAETLGWAGATWDFDSRANVALTKSWGEHTEEEVRCLHVMGYHEHNWHSAAKGAAPEPAPSAPSPKPKPSPKSPAGSKFGFTDREAHYEDVPWSRLPPAARRAAKALGYTPETWDAQEWCEYDDWHWWDLEGEVKDACEALGWDEGAWEHYGGGYYWSDMPAHARRAATKLGWSREKWDEDWHVDCWHKGWEEFSEEERRCLHVMGYYRLTWD